MNIRRYLLMFIICISSFIIYTNNVNALTTSGVLSDTTASNFININAGSISGTYYGDHRPYFKGYGEGYVIFSVLTANSASIVDQVTSIIVRNSNDIFTCDIGNNTSYYDSQTERILYTVKCDVNFPSGRGLDNIRVDRSDTYGILKVNFSQYITFVSKDSVVDVSSIVNAISSQTNSLISNNNSNTTQIINNINNVYTSLNSILNSINGIDTKLNDIKNNSTNISNNTQEIKDKINDSSIDNDSASSSASGWASKNASNNTITQLLTLPISLLTNITNSINSSCSSFSLGFLFDTELILPCINLNDYLGSTLVSIIDILFSGFMIYNIAKKLIKIFNDFTNLKSNQIDEIYGGGNE